MSKTLFLGLLSISGISLLSLTGLLFLPIIKGKWRNRWMQVFIALAVSTMSSDALLHILPQVLGAHNHDYHDHAHHDHNDFDIGHNRSDHHHHHHHNHDQHEETGADHEHVQHIMLLKMTAVIGAVYALYLLEFICSLPKILDISKVEKTTHDGWSESETASDEQMRKSGDGSGGGIADEPVVMCGLKSSAFVIIFGDAIHNFIDGIAVGASFVISNQVGLATSLAVACHELPHELGDFAVLIESGLSVPRAMIFNFLSALTAYAGLFVGLAAISVNSAVELLLAVTAGMFLYVAWLDMLVHLKTEAASKGDKWYVTLLLQNIGFVTGFAIMFAIGWYEEALASL